jgi:hypothetical protein
MSRQTERATARHQAKVDKANARKPGSYPASVYVPYTAVGKTYAANGKQEVARRLRQQAAA